MTWPQNARNLISEDLNLTILIDAVLHLIEYLLVSVVGAINTSVMHSKVITDA